MWITCSMEINIQEEMTHLQLGDPRRARRFSKIVSQLANNPSSSITERAGKWSDIKGAYRFFGSKHIKETAIAEGIYKATRERCLENEVVLCIQDTTNISFDSSAEGLGYLDHGRGKGLLSHNILAVDRFGCPLGLLDQHIWARDPEEMGKAQTRKQRPIIEKESYRWIEGIKKCEGFLSNCKKIVTIADREADIYEFFSMRRAVNSELLIRVTHDRKTLLGNTMWKEIEQEEVIGEFELQIDNPITGGSRVAKMSIRSGMVILQPPKQRADLPAICVEALLVREQNAAANEKPLEWMLISSIRPENGEEAVRLVRWYSYRWRIE